MTTVMVAVAKRKERKERKKNRKRKKKVVTRSQPRFMQDCSIKGFQLLCCIGYEAHAAFLAILYSEERQRNALC